MARYRRSQLEDPIITPLWIAKVRLVTKNEDAIIKKTYVVVAPDEENAARKVRWVVDMALWKSVKITGVMKVATGTHVIAEQRRKVPQAVASEEDRATPTAAEKQRTNQRSLPWAVGIIGVVDASTEQGALRRVGDFLNKRSNGIDCETPFREGGYVRFEALGEGVAMNITDYLRGMAEAKNAHMVRTRSTGSTR